MNENKGRFPWRDWARFEAVDKDGQAWQFADNPMLVGRWFPVQKSTYAVVGRLSPPVDHTKTLIERYPSEQADPAPFVFGPEHIGKRVRHTDGNKGIVLKIDKIQNTSNQLSVLWEGGIVCRYSLQGKLLASDPKITIFLDESTPDQTPDLLARVEVLEAHKIQSDADFKKLYSSVIELTKQQQTDKTLLVKLINQLDDIGDDLDNLRQSRKVTQSGDVSFDDLRFVLPENNTETKSANEVVFSGEEISKAFNRVCDDVFKTEPDPTAAKVEALKLLFEWRDRCEFMTVDAKFGIVWQWGNEPVNDSKVWASKGGDMNARRVGQINFPDPQLCQILITRTNG